MLATAHDESLDFRREQCGVCVGHHEPDVVPDDSRFRKTEGFSKLMDSDSSRLHVEPVPGNIGLAYPGQVGGNYGELVRELWNQRPPHLRGLRIAVQENNQRAGTSFEIVNFCFFSRRELRVY
jgi:hypothetical protein